MNKSQVWWRKLFKAFVLVLLSKRVLLSIFAILIIQFSFWITLIFLIYLDPQKAAALATMEKDFMTGIVTVAFFMISGETLVNWRYNSSSDAMVKNLSQEIHQTEDQTQNVNQNLKEDISYNGKFPPPKMFDDGSIE